MHASKFAPLTDKPMEQEFTVDDYDRPQDYVQACLVNRNAPGEMDPDKCSLPVLNPQGELVRDAAQQAVDHAAGAMSLLDADHQRKLRLKLDILKDRLASATPQHNPQLQGGARMNPIVNQLLRGSAETFTVEATDNRGGR